MAAFATYTDMIAQYDEQTLRDLCSDDGVPESNLANNSKMTAALSRATGAILAAIKVGGLYSDADIAALADESLAYLVGITCEIAMCYLILRRPEKFGEAAKECREQVEALLDRFRKGERVFEVPANIAAGNPTIDGPSTVEVINMNLITSRARRYYPSNHRLPLGR